MSDADDTLAKLEEQFLAAKEGGELTDDLRQRLREARRKARSQSKSIPGPGDAVVAPDVIQGRAGVNN